MRIARFGASLIAALLIAAPVSAQEESVHLDYDAGAGCPDRAAFIGEITARTTRARFVDEGNDIRTFKATIHPQGERIVGFLISNTGQAGAERRVSGKTCSEVASALALITALAIDPSASTHPAPTAPADTPPAANQRVGAAAASDVAPKPSTTSIPIIDKSNDQRTTVRWGFSAGVEGVGSYGFGADGPLQMLGGSLLAEAGPLLRDDRGPLFRISGLLLYSPTVDPLTSSQPTGSAVFRLLTGRIAISPVSVRVTGSFELHPWLSTEVGQLRGEGIKGGVLATTEDQSATWIAVGQSLEGRFYLGRSLWLALELGAVEPLVQQRFVFQHPSPVTPIRSIPYFEPILAAGLGWRIL